MSLHCYLAISQNLIFLFLLTVPLNFLCEFPLVQLWTFVLSKASLKVSPTLTSSKKDEEEIEMDGPLRLVLIDAKLVKVVDDDNAPGGK